MRISDWSSDVCSSDLRLGDVATVELGGENYGIASLYNGKPAAGLAIKQASDANALDTVNAIHKTVDSLKPFFPAGMEEIGRASCRERVCQYVKISVDAVSLKKTNRSRCLINTH